MGAISLLSLSLLLLLFYLTPSHSAVITLNTSSPCVLQGTPCSFTDPTTWEGRMMANAQDGVLVNSLIPLTLLLEDDKVTVQSITIHGPVAFILSNATLILSVINWDMNETVRVQNSAKMTIIGNQYSSGGLLYINGSSVTAGKILVSTKVINSTFTADVFDGSIDASGPGTSLQFIGLYSRNITVDRIAKIAVKSMTLDGKFTISRTDSAAFEEIKMKNNASIHLIQGVAPGRIYLGDIVRAGANAKLILQDSSVATVGYVTGVDFAMGDGATLIVNDYVGFTTIEQAPNTYSWIYASFGTISFDKDASFRGSIILGITEGSVMEVRKSLVITPPLLREPCVSHGHLRVFTKASLICVEGNIYVSKVTLSSGARVTSWDLTAKQMIASNSTITARVTVNGSGGDEDGLQILDDTLYINGTYTQNSGYLHARLSENHNTPFLLVKKDISLSRVQVILTSLISSFFAGWQKLIMAESEAKALSAAPQILEATNQDSSIYYTVTIKDGVMFVSRTTLKLYQVLIAIVATIAAIFGVLTYYYRIWKRRHNLRVVNEHELVPLQT